jgi:phosphatidylinositol-3-phosphatase
VLACGAAVAAIVALAPATPVAQAGTVPALDHVFTIVMENTSFNEIVGSSAAPYINSLLAGGGLGANYFAVTHPSLPNYLALTGASTFRIASDCTTCWVAAPNIADSVESAGKTWKAYEESMPSACFVGDSYPYAQKHDPFIYYNDIRTNSARCQSHVVPYSQLSTDLRSTATTPSYAFITPNLCDDMHDCTVATGDSWLSQQVPAILGSAAFRTQRSLLALVWDEDDSSQNNQVPLVLVGSSLIGGHQSLTAYDHYSLLHTTEVALGLGTVNTVDAGAALMGDFFSAVTSGVPPPSPSPVPSTPAAFHGLYTLDAYGGVNPVNGSAALAPSATWGDWNIARAAHALPNSLNSGLVLDGWGGLHPYGASVSVQASAYWSGWDIARDFAFLPDGSGGVVLDGWGGLHAFHVNGSTYPINVSPTAYWTGWDIARKVVVFADGSGGYVLDGWGGIHPFGINGPPPVAASAIVQTGYWTGWNIARDIVLVAGDGGHSGYTLDGWGGTHPFHVNGDGSVMPANLATAYWTGWDIARGMWLLPGSASAGYTLDGWGGLHPFGGAPAISSQAYWPGRDIAKSVLGA